MRQFLLRSAALLFLTMLLSACAAHPANSQAANPSTAPATAQAPDELLGPPHALATTQSAGQPSTQPLSGEAADAQVIVNYLASPELEGRGLSTKGLDLAADYVAGRFHVIGLKTLPGQKDYFQSFDLTWAQDVLPETSLTLHKDDAPINWQLAKDFTALSFSADQTYPNPVPVVFVGYGITSDKPAYDDYAGIDVHGKFALAMRFEPIDAKGKSRLGKGDWSDRAHLENKARLAAEHGAVGLILMNPPKSKAPASLLPFARTFKDSKTTIPVIHITPATAETLLKNGGVAEPGKIADSLDSDFKPHSFDLPGVAISGKVALNRTTKELKNVIGYLPGQGEHADEYVFVGAHYDHLGRGGPGSLLPGSHAIHPGADDNASGTAALIEMATTIAREASQHALQRSIIFAAFTAEEEGLIGSQHFVAHPLVPLDHIAAMLNMDMVGRVKNNMIYVVGAGTAPSFDKMVERAFVDSPLKEKSSGRGGLGPSDHMTFALKKIPVLFLFSGIHSDYHRPTDTADKINYVGLAHTADVAVRIVDEMETMPREKYVDSADSSSMMISSSGDSTGAPRGSLGVVPDYTDDQTAHGVRIAGTTPDTAAAKAGLRQGDVLIGLGDHKIDSLMDLSDILSSHSPGDTLTLKYIRDGKEISVEVTLTARRM